MKVKQHLCYINELSGQPDFRYVYEAPTEAEKAESKATIFGWKVIAVGGALLTLIIFWLSCLA